MFTSNRLIASSTSLIQAWSLAGANGVGVKEFPLFNGYNGVELGGNGLLEDPPEDRDTIKHKREIKIGMLSQ